MMHANRRDSMKLSEWAMDDLSDLTQWLTYLSSEWVTGVLLFFSLSTVLWLIKRLVFYYLGTLFRRAGFDWGAICLTSAYRAVTVIVVAISLIATKHYLLIFHNLSDYWVQQMNLLSQIMLIIAILLFCDTLARKSLDHATSESSSLRSSRNLLRGIIRITIYVVSALVILSTLGITITPIVASLGIGSLAVALALQPTLENFFSGIQMVADKPIRVGDFIELDSGEQGFVEKIGWRSTWIKMLPNNVVIMPNSVLAQSKVINYYYPEKQLSVPVEVSVHYNSDLDHVERVTLEVAREILRNHEWGVDDYKTFVIFTGFGDSSINLTVMLRAQEYFNRFFIRSAFIKALHKRYALEGIVIPFPIRALNLQQENVSNDTIQVETKY